MTTSNVPPTDLSAHITELDRCIADEFVKLTNCRARLAAGEKLGSIARQNYASTLRKPAPSEMSIGTRDFDKLTALHNEWLQDTIQLRDMLRVELLIRTRLQEVITDVPAFMNGVAGTLSWASILQAIQSVVDNLPADE
jgi:hypothetical protein